MINVRTKGASFERQIAKKLNEFFEKKNIYCTAKRNLDQYQVKSLADIDLPYFSIECKRYNSGVGYKKEWWVQTKKASQNKVPVLVYKYNHQPIRVVIPLNFINSTIGLSDEVAEVTFDTFLTLLEKSWDKKGLQRQVA